MLSGMPTDEWDAAEDQYYADLESREREAGLVHELRGEMFNALIRCEHGINRAISSYLGLSDDKVPYLQKALLKRMLMGAKIESLRALNHGQ